MLNDNYCGDTSQRQTGHPPDPQNLILREYIELMATSKPNSIVIKFHQYKTKEEVLRKAWEKNVILLNNQRINFDYDYPATLLSKQKEYNTVKWVQKGKKIRFQTPYPAR